MDRTSLQLSVLTDNFSIVRLEPDADVPEWCLKKNVSFGSITRTHDELSIVCLDEHVPTDQKADRGWRALKVIGPLDLSLSGIFSNLISSLAEAKISVFAMSTFETDYLLVKEEQLEKTVEALSRVSDVNVIV